MDEQHLLDTLGRVTAQLYELKASLKDARAKADRIATLQSAIHEKDSKICDLEETADDLARQRDRAETQCHKYATSLESTQTKLNFATDLKARLVIKVEKLEAKLAERFEDTITQQGREACLEQSVQAERTRVVQAQQEIATLRKQVAQLKRSNTMLKKQIGDTP